MNKGKWCTILLVLCTSMQVHAVCPGGVQQSAVHFVNGVSNPDKLMAAESAAKLRSELTKDPRFKPDCTAITLAYNPSGKSPQDNIVEAFVQKATELNVPLRSVVMMMTNLMTPAPWFLDVSLDYTILMGKPLGLSEQVVADHLALYRNALAEKKKVEILTHSQGGFFANIERESMTPAEQAETSIVTVATPSDHVSGGGEGRNTTLSEDLVAQLFLGALPANTTNGDACTKSPIGAFACHDFIASYLTGTTSRTRIIEQVLSVLPGYVPSDPFVHVTGYVNWSAGPLNTQPYDNGTLEFTCYGQFTGTLYIKTGAGGNFEFPPFLPCDVQKVIFTGTLYGQAILRDFTDAFILQNGKSLRAGFLYHFYNADVYLPEIIPVSITGTLSVSVSSTLDDIPIPNAIVTLSCNDLNGVHATQTTTTGSEGSFAFPHFTICNSAVMKFDAIFNGVPLSVTAFLGKLEPNAKVIMNIRRVFWV